MSFAFSHVCNVHSTVISIISLWQNQCKSFLCEWPAENVCSQARSRAHWDVFLAPSASSWPADPACSYVIVPSALYFTLLYFRAELNTVLAIIWVLSCHFRSILFFHPEFSRSSHALFFLTLHSASVQLWARLSPTGNGSELMWVPSPVT